MMKELLGEDEEQRADNTMKGAEADTQPSAPPRHALPSINGTLQHGPSKILFRASQCHKYKKDLAKTAQHLRTTNAEYNNANKFEISLFFINTQHFYSKETEE